MQGDWKVETLRLTFFVSGTWTLRPLFLTTVGIMPTQVVTQPQMSAQTETGPAFGAFMSVTQNPGRVDLVLSDFPPPPGMPPMANKPFFWAGDFNLVKEFDAVLRASGSLVTDCTRIAYALAALRPAATMADAMRLAKLQLPQLDFDPTSDSDLIYQVNRNIPAPEVGIAHCLWRWDAIRTKRVLVVAGPTGLITTKPLEAFAARTSVDVSTDEMREKLIESSKFDSVIEFLKATAHAALS